MLTNRIYTWPSVDSVYMCSFSGNGAGLLQFPRRRRWLHLLLHRGQLEDCSRRLRGPGAGEERWAELIYTWVANTGKETGTNSIQSNTSEIERRAYVWMSFSRCLLRVSSCEPPVAAAFPLVPLVAAGTASAVLLEILCLLQNMLPGRNPHKWIGYIIFYH